jgi:aspartate carbamoyltransferase catalytic subunit
MKGETEMDSVKTFSEYVDLIIMRHSSTNFIYDISSEIGKEKVIINAGSGTDQHPTQALLDFYTIYKYGLHNKKIAFVGDLKRGRTVRSLALLLSNVKDIKLYFVAPKAFQISDDIVKDLKVDYEMVENYEEILPKMDIIYMTRLQDEYGGIEEVFDRKRYSIDKNNLKLLKKNAIIMHPLPRREEIDVEVDKDNRAKYWEQVNNGMWVRVALILKLFGKENEILKKDI